MHAMSVYIAREQFIRHQPVVCTRSRSEDFCTRVVRAILHTHVFMNFKSSCTAFIINMSERASHLRVVLICLSYEMTKLDILIISLVCTW